MKAPVITFRGKPVTNPILVAGAVLLFMVAVPAMIIIGILWMIILVPVHVFLKAFGWPGIIVVKWRRK